MTRYEDRRGKTTSGYAPEEIFIFITYINNMGCYTNIKNSLLVLVIRIFRINVGHCVYRIYLLYFGPLELITLRRTYT